MSASSHSLSFPALLAKLRSLLPSDRHAELDAVSESINSAPSDKAAVRSSVAAAPRLPRDRAACRSPLQPPPDRLCQVQRRLCEIAGKELVQAAVLGLLGQQDCRPPDLQDCRPPELPAELTGAPEEGVAEAAEAEAEAMAEAETMAEAMAEGMAEGRAGGFVSRGLSPLASPLAAEVMTAADVAMTEDSTAAA